MSITRYNPYLVYESPPGIENLVRVIDHGNFHITVHYVNYGDNIYAIERTIANGRIVNITETVISEIDILFEARF